MLAELLAYARALTYNLPFLQDSLARDSKGYKNLAVQNP